MIRINLLPIRKIREAQSSRNFVVVLGASLAAVLVVLLVVDRMVSADVDSKKQRNALLRADIEKVRREIADHDRIRSELEDIHARQEAIEKLKAARVGPAYMLLEMSKILSAGGGPTIDREQLEQIRHDNPLAVPNDHWDPRRLWITQFTEQNREVHVTGSARSNEDVAELLRRLVLSSYFFDVVLERTEQIDDPNDHVRVIRFNIRCHVRYQ